MEIRVSKIPPYDHDRGDGWVTRADCKVCDEYVNWFD